MSYRRIATMALAALLVASGTHAAVLCARKSGALKLRDAACKGKETQVDPAALGLQGPKGDPGTDGSAFAYATVFYSGGITGGKNTAQMSITHPSAGVYCFDTAFTPTHIEATLESGSTIRATLDAASVIGCADTDDAAVLTFDYLPGEDHGFNVLFEK